MSVTKRYFSGVKKTFHVIVFTYASIIILKTTSYNIIYLCKYYYTSEFKENRESYDLSLLW